jgi:hypothetical protein
VTVANSTLSGNSANASNGGGIDNALYGLLTVTDSTLSGNTAGTLGGGISNENRGTVTVTSCTVSANTARSGGGINNTFGPVTLGNTIVAGNTGGDISGSGTYSQTYSLVGGQPRLAPLGDYGGPTQTMPLLAGSPALNAGDPAQLGTADQRGVVRSGGVNIGAYQASASALVLTAPATVTAGMAFNITVKAVDPFGQVAVGYSGTVHFTATNGASANYAFTAADGGQHTFPVTLLRAGTLGVTGTDTANAAITGSTSFTVVAAAPAHIVFTVPGTITAGVPFSITVTIQDAYGNTATGYTGTVHFTLTGPAMAQANYTFTAVDMGSHTFSNLVLNQAGDYTLTGMDIADPMVRGSTMFTVSA